MITDTSHFSVMAYQEKRHCDTIHCFMSVVWAKWIVCATFLGTRTYFYCVTDDFGNLMAVSKPYV